MDYEPEEEIGLKVDPDEGPEELMEVQRMVAHEEEIAAIGPDDTEPDTSLESETVERYEELQAELHPELVPGVDGAGE